MINLEQQLIEWDGDRSLLPPIPDNDQNPALVEEFIEKMDNFIELWDPSPPEGDGWVLIQKRWFCADICGECGIPADSNSGSCKLKGVKPQSVWQRSI